jgi:hypothetical protein
MTSQAIPANDATASADAVVPQQPVADDADPEASVPTLGSAAPAPVEIGGRDGPDPTRYGDWEMRGRCIDF